MDPRAVAIVIVAGFAIYAGGQVVHVVKKVVPKVVHVFKHEKPAEVKK